MKKTIIRLLGFFLILIVILGYLNRTYAIKSADGIEQCSVFYKQPKDSIDVLILGSSHAFVNFNNGTLYDEYGIASYNLAASTQPMWNTYYYLKEALKTQSPELIVLEGYGLGFDLEYLDDALNYKNLYGMKWSLDKLEAIKVSTEPEKFKDFVLEYPIYHTRYSSLQKGDFLDDYGSENRDYNWLNKDWKGQYLFSTSAPQNNIDVSGVNYTKELVPKTEEYYRKILELANEKDIPVLVTIVPFDMIGELEEFQARFNRAEEIAEEYGASFLNCQTRIEEIGLDLQSDYRDACHMSVWGTIKFSKYIGRYIKDNYLVSDRRGDSRYVSWANNAEYVNRYYLDSLLKYHNNLGDLVNMLNDPNYWVFISVDGECNTSDEHIRKFLEGQGIFESETTGIWLKQGGAITWSSCGRDEIKYISNEYHDFCLRRDNDINTCIIDNVAWNNKVINGMNVIIYDVQTNIIIDNFGVDKDANYTIVR